jgi:phage terminase Nu1 subunit (DNA packaging protein)
MRVNRNGLAKIFGVHVGTVTAWLDRGCPVVERGGKARPWAFETADVIAWHTDRAISEAITQPIAGEGTALDAARLRKLNAEAESAEIKLAEQAGRLVRIADVTASLDEVLVPVKAKLGALPTRLAVRLAAAMTREDARAALHGGIQDCLAELQLEAAAYRRAKLEKIDDDEDEFAD